MTYNYINQLQLHVYIYIYIYILGERQDFGLAEDIGQNFIYDFLSTPVLQWRRQNFGSGRHSVKMHSSKTFENVLKIYKKFAQKFNKFSEFY